MSSTQKTGYVVETRRYDGFIVLLEVQILGTIIPNNGIGKNTCLVADKGTILWKAARVAGKVGTKAHISNSGKMSSYVEGTCIRDDVILDLVAAKQAAELLVTNGASRVKQMMEMYQKEFKFYKNFDINNFPKDEYISPFTGKKT